MPLRASAQSFPFWKTSDPLNNSINVLSVEIVPDIIDGRLFQSLSRFQTGPGDVGCDNAVFCIEKGIVG